MNVQLVRDVLAAAENIDAEDGDQGFVPDYGDGPDLPPSEPDASPTEISATFAENDHGNGQRFAAHFGQDALWVPRVGWFIWDGSRWGGDADGNAARALAQKLGPLIESEVDYLAPTNRTRALMDQEMNAEAEIERLSALETRDEAAETALKEAKISRADALNKMAAMKNVAGKRLGFAKTTGNSGRIDNALKEGGIKLLRPLDVLDAEALDINTKSGVLRIDWVDDWTGVSDKKEPQIRLIAHGSDDTRSLLMTKIMDVAYDPKAASPLFDKFLTQIQPDAQMRAFLLRWFGLGMTALTGEQKLCFFYGMGANGKSVLVDLISRLMGDYAATAKIESLTGTNRRGGGDATPDLVPLIGARFVRASEPDEGVKWQEGLIKDLTGGEKIMVRALHSDFVEAHPKFKLTISGNHKPDIRGTDDGIWRRLLLIPFDEQIPKEKRIPKDKLDAMLFAEGPGILNRLIGGLLDYLQNGLGEPDKVIEATAEFREESDPYGQFLNAACVVTGDHADSLPAATLIEAFNFWRASPMGGGLGVFQPTTVGKALAQRAERWRSPEGKRFTRRKSSNWYYDGIRLGDVFKRVFDSVDRDQNGKINMKGVTFDEPSQTYHPDF